MLTPGAVSVHVQGAGQISSANIDALEMGKRLAVERELESLEDTLSTCKPAFDDSGNFLVRFNGIVWCSTQAANWSVLPLSSSSP